MTYRVWYRTYTDYVDVIPGVAAFDTLEQATEFATQYMGHEAQRHDQYVKSTEIQHVQCGEPHLYCECEEER